MLGAMLCPALLCAAGCASTWLGSGQDESPDIALQDFVGQGSADTQTPTSIGDADTQDNTTLTSTSADPQDQNTGTQVTQAQDTPPNSESALPINGMVGHVNGEAIYADQIFDINLAAQLRNYGERFDGENFRTQAAFEIQQRLKDVVVDKLILGEAERNLTDNQRYSINGQIQAERDELLRFYGQGSLSRAEAEFFADRGVELDAYLATRRDELALGVYLRSMILPRISVNQSLVERWYEENIDRFQQPAHRIFRIIRVDSQANPQAQQTVLRRLRRGEAFEAVAADPALNIYNASNGGIYNNGEPYAGDYGIEPVNEALMQLDQGEYAGPVAVGNHHFFVYLVELEPAVSIPLREAQTDIEVQLTNQQYLDHVNRFAQELLDRGGFSDRTEMLAKLLDIAAARYDQ